MTRKFIEGRITPFCKCTCPIARDRCPTCPIRAIVDAIKNERETRHREVAQTSRDNLKKRWANRNKESGKE